MNSHTLNTNACRSSHIVLTKRSQLTIGLDYEKLLWHDCSGGAGPCSNGDCQMSGLWQEGYFPLEWRYPVWTKDTVMLTDCRLTFRLDRTQFFGRNSPWGYSAAPWVVDIVVIQTANGYVNNAGADLDELKHNMHQTPTGVRGGAYQNPLVGSVAKNSVPGGLTNESPYVSVVYRKRVTIEPSNYHIYLYGAGVYPGYPPQWLEVGGHQTLVWEDDVKLRFNQQWNTSVNANVGGGLGKLVMYARLDVAGHYLEEDQCILSVGCKLGYLNKF